MSVKLKQQSVFYLICICSPWKQKEDKYDIGKKSGSLSIDLRKMYKEKGTSEKSGMDGPVKNMWSSEQRYKRDAQSELNCPDTFLVHEHTILFLHL